MNTSHVLMSLETQAMLATLRTLFPDPESETAQDVISFGCSINSNPKYPEKILNLSWKLAGEWKTINLASAFSASEGKNLFEQIKNEEDPVKKRDIIFTLYKHPKAENAKVYAKDFKRGIQKLYKKISKQQNFDTKEAGKGVMPTLVISSDYKAYFLQPENRADNIPATFREL